MAEQDYSPVTTPASDFPRTQPLATNLDAAARFTHVRSVIQHENDLLNHRLTWMWTLQGFLFASLGFAVEKDVVVLFAICAVGFVSCVSVGYTLWVGTRVLNELNQAAGRMGQTIDPALGLQTTETKVRFVWLFPWFLLPWFMATVWVAMAFYLIVVRPFLAA